MGDLVLHKEEQPPWVSYIHKRIKENKNFLGIITGPTGAGKSWSAIRLCELIDPEFNIDRVVFRGSELLELINSKTLKKGSCVIWDESGIDLSSRNWQSTTNKLLNFLLQTFRHKNIVLFFTSPYSDFVDSSTRKLFHAEIKMIAIDRESECAIAKPLLLQYNSSMRKFYQKFLRLIDSNGDVVQVKSIAIGKPSKAMITAYEIKKGLFTDKLNQSIGKQLKDLEDKELHPKQLTDKQSSVLELYNRGLTLSKIGEELGVSKSMICSQLRLIRKKNYRVCRPVGFEVGK